MAKSKENMARFADEFTLISQCLSCLNFRPQDGNFKCTAFETGIPWEITVNRFDHRKTHEGDHDIHYVWNKKKPQFYK